MDIAGFVALLIDPVRIEFVEPQHNAGLLERLAPYAWPIVTLLCLLVLRRPIALFLHRIGAQATELTIGWASVKLPGLQEAAADQAMITIKDLTGSQWLESGSNLLAQFQIARTSEYALVDLGIGGEWISSRLFIFAVMLQRMKGLRCIVFVATINTHQRTFIGCATPESVRWQLATDQPWLEAAFAQAYANITLPPSVLSRGEAFTDTKGALKPETAQRVVSSFIQSLKEPTPHRNASEFVTINSGDERATWITVSELERIMGRAIWVDSVQENTDATPEGNRLHVRRILDKQAPYVAQVKDGEFLSLIGRVQLLDELARRFK